MKLVIDIPESIYYTAQKTNILEANVRALADCIKNGTPLPTGHGRLIDADILDECKEIMNDICGESKYAVKMDNIRNIPTIIEADKTESEEKE